MKIECMHERLAGAVGRAQRFVGKNLSLPVLSCVLLEAKSGSLSVRATNLDVGFEETFPIKIIEEGIAAIPAAVFANLLSATEGSRSVVLERHEGTIRVVSARNASVINTQPNEDFPVIPIVRSANRFTLPTKDFVAGIRAVLFSASVSTVKPEYSSVYAYKDGEGIVFVATDSFRLAEKKVRVKKSFDMEPILLPYKNAVEIVRIAAETDGDVEIDIDNSQISFSFGDLHVTSRLINGAFPDYKQIIPKTSETEVVVLKDDFADAMKVANIFSDSFMQMNIDVAPKQKKLEVKTKNASVGEQTYSLQAAFSGEPVAMNFNHRYVTDCLPSIGSDSVTLSFAGAGKPLVIRGASDKTFTYLVMPMNR